MVVVGGGGGWSVCGVVVSMLHLDTSKVAYRRRAFFRSKEQNNLGCISSTDS